MSTCNVVGKVKNSAQDLLTGVLKITLDARLIDTSTVPDTVHLPEPEYYPVTAGVIDLDLPESQTSNITYHFEFIVTDIETIYYLPNGDTYQGVTHVYMGGTYTGASHTGESILLTPVDRESQRIIQDFHAIVPDVAEYEWASLLETGITTDVLDTSARRIKELLQSDPDFVESIKPRQLGEWNESTFYSYTDTVGYAGSSWTWIADEPGSGIVPSTNPPSDEYWQLSASKGDPGGTGGDDTPFNAVSWNNSLDAPSKNAVRDIILTLAPLDSPTFTGDPRVPTFDVSITDQRTASTLYVDQKITNRFINAALTGNPTAPTQANANRSDRIATTQFVKDTYHRYSLIQERVTSNPGTSSVVGINRRNLNTIVTNAGDILSVAGGIISMRSGTYRVRGEAVAFKPGHVALTLQQMTPFATKLLTGLKMFSSADTTFATSIEGIINIGDDGTTLEMWHHIQTSQVGGLGSYFAFPSDSTTNIFSQLEFWRID